MSGPAPRHEHRVRLDDGRQLVCAEYGTPAGLPVLYLHGFLGSRLEPRVAGEVGLHLLALDRPGYGASSPCPGLSLRGFARDAAVLLDRLGVGAVGVVGVSAGGPYAMATAAVLGERVRRLALVAAVGNKKILRRQGGAVRLMEPVRRHGRLALALAPVILRNLRRHGLDLTLIGLILRSELPHLAPGVDPEQVRRLLIVSMREGTRRGIAGALADLELLTRKWDTSPREVGCPTLVMHGALDRVVPPAHARWYAERLSRARLEIVPECGHISLAVNRAREIAAFLRGEA